jgi:ABC-type lipoprotein export system ATPase subunit
MSYRGARFDTSVSFSSVLQPSIFDPLVMASQVSHDLEPEARPAVEARDLFRVYSTPEGDAAALQGLSLTVGEGEVLALLGPSGSGKTTLMRILAGLERPSAGSVHVFGLELAKLGHRRLARYRARLLGYADQHYAQALAPEASIREAIALPLGLRGLSRGEQLARADTLLERVGLLDRRDARPPELSGGEQQRVAICAALAHRPRLFLADEPTGELDADTAKRLFAMIGDLAREEGATTIVVSHDPEIAAIADRVVQIRDGRLASEARRGGRRGAAAIVVGRGGWLQLPEEYLRRAGIRARAQARMDAKRITIWATDGRDQPPDRAATPRRSPEHRRGGDRSIAELRAVTKIYDGTRATVVLRALDASFKEGRLSAITGPSGSGKTTLLHLLAGLELPTSGEVIVLDSPVSRLSRRDRAALRRDHVAVVGQQPGLIPFLSARENVELGLALRRRRAQRDAAMEALAAVHLLERSEQRVSRLSTGEQVRVAIARAVAPRAELLLADEPTARLDQANALAIATLLERLAGELGIGIVCATHDPLVIEQADEELSLRAMQQATGRGAAIGQ